MAPAVSFPLGVRFAPTDEELLLVFLKNRIKGEKLPIEAIRELNLYDYEPSDLPGMSCLDSKDRMWYFFCRLEKKYKKGKRISRVTGLGFWKITGNSTPVMSHSRLVGERKDLVFHNGKPPGNQESRTNWVMHEFSLNDKELGGSCNQENLVVCKIFEKSGKGPQNGAQYGAPVEEIAREIIDEIVPSLSGNAQKSVTYNGSSVTQSLHHDLREKSQEFETSFISHHSSPGHEPHKRSHCEYRENDTLTSYSIGMNEKFVPYNGNFVTKSPHIDLREKPQEFETSFVSHCSSPGHEPHKRSRCESGKKVDTSTSFSSGTNEKGFHDDDHQLHTLLMGFGHEGTVNMEEILAGSHQEKGHSHLENENQYREGLYACEILRTTVVPTDPHNPSIDLLMEDDYLEVDDMKFPMTNVYSTEICDHTHGLHGASVLSSIEANTRQGDAASPIAKVGDQDGCCS